MLIIMLILSRVVACDSLRPLLSFRAVNRTCRAIVEGTYLDPFYRSLLAKWNVSAVIHERARKYKTVFSLVLRELHAGRCATCRKRVDRAGAPLGGVCRACRMDHALILYQRNRPVFGQLPARSIVGIGVEPAYYPKRVAKPANRRARVARLSKTLLMSCLGLPHRIAVRFSYRERYSCTRRYELPVVERVMAAWTGRVEPPINVAVDWRALDQADDEGGGGVSDRSENDEDDEEGDEDEDDDSDDDDNDALLIRPVEE
ncbi:hypothetical protein GGF32_007473 [Allomyces javanicus]|nr:hypothetical protein GGF32_007473 [Allomyces javanicus]